MFRTAIIALALMGSSISQAAPPPPSVSAVQVEMLYVQETYAKTCEFLDKHTKEVIEASGSEILSEKDNRLKLKNIARRETNIFTVERRQSKGEYKTVLVETHEGRLSDLSTSVKVEVEKEGRTLITITTKATVNNERIKESILTRNLQKHLKESTVAVKEYLQEHLK